MKTKIFAIVAAGTMLAAITLSAAQVSINVQADKPGIRVSPTLWGIFFEDINCSADGGIYPELVRNRSFEDTDQPEFWSVIKSGYAEVEMKLDDSDPISDKNPHSLKVTVAKPGPHRAGVANEGWWGMGIKKGGVYNLSLMARGGDGFSGPLTVSLESVDGVVYAQMKIATLTTAWKEYTAALIATDGDPTARLVISATKAGTFWLDNVSLFPKDTWKNRPNGLRSDLAGMLEKLGPAFVRFPGGCWVEGERMATSYRWKQTIGDLSDRRTQYNLWKYYATHGLGFHEYLQMCEDLRAEPLFVINCGMSHQETVPMDQMGDYVQDALDAIEYCNGPADSTWGSVRAKNGHPAPFNLKYMEIGNENGGKAYAERYPLFIDAIRAKYPEMHLVADDWSGTPTNRPVEIRDEHYYSNPQWFIDNATHFDSYDRKGAKVYVGEYAVTEGTGKGSLRGAVAEAAFMTGMERNSDVVVMASYAPLFVNVNQRSWSPDLIDFDSDRVFGIPSYYVQKMFNDNRGDVILPTKVDAPPPPTEPIRGAVGVGTWETQAEYKDMKVTRGDDVLYQSDFSGGTNGWTFGNGDWKAVDGVLRQSAPGTDLRAITGDKDWTNYTYTLKARKLSGREGFLILFGMKDGQRNWWNIGGWGNTETALEVDGAQAGQHVKLAVEKDRWYDIRIEVQNDAVKCYLDGKLIHDVKVQHAGSSVFVSTTRKESSGEIILKVVNVAPQAQAAEIKIEGVSALTGPAKAVVLSAADPMDENSFAAPTKVLPVTKTIAVAGDTLRETLPGNSVTIVRVKARFNGGTAP